MTPFINKQIRCCAEVKIPGYPDGDNELGSDGKKGFLGGLGVLFFNLDTDYMICKQYCIVHL